MPRRIKDDGTNLLQVWADGVVHGMLATVLVLGFLARVLSDMACGAADRIFDD
jgi:hypothetical protein